MRDNKGKSIIAIPDDYVIIDIETTGLSSSYDDIIELAAVKIHGDEVVSSFQTLVNPDYEIDEFITELTGITNEMLKDAPSISQQLPIFLDYVGGDVVIGHNVSFDVNFIYDVVEKNNLGYFSNEHIDTRRIFRKLFPDLAHHRLKDMVSFFNVDTKEFHRALADCMSTYNCYLQLKKVILDRYELGDKFADEFKKKRKNHLNAADIKAQVNEFDETHPLYNMSCVFTGTLERMTRAEAMQRVVNLGGLCEDRVTRKTNYLIMGNTDYSRVKDGKSSKVKKAESYILKGEDISIIPESVFYDLIGLSEEELSRPAKPSREDKMSKYEGFISKGFVISFPFGDSKSDD